MTVILEEPAPPSSRRRQRVRRRRRPAGPLCAVCAGLVDAGGAGWAAHRRCALVLSAYREGWAAEIDPPSDAFETARARSAGVLAVFEACARREITPEEAAAVLAPPGDFPVDEAETAVRGVVLTPTSTRVGWAVGHYAGWTVLAFLVAAAIRSCVVRVEAPWP